MTAMAPGDDLTDDPPEYDPDPPEPDDEPGWFGPDLDYVHDPGRSEWMA